MLRIYPEQYRQFQCTASACRHSCCVGWEITVDEETSKRYAAAEGSFAQTVRDALEQTDSGTVFRMEQGRCVMLQKDGLCRMIREWGGEALCEICREHPRFHNRFEGVWESGLGLCCEEAARLTLTRQAPLRLCVEETDDMQTERPDEKTTAILHLCGAALALLQNRSMPLFHRLGLLLALGTDAQLCLEREDIGALFHLCDAYGDDTHHAALWQMLSARISAQGDAAWPVRRMALYLSQLPALEASWHTDMLKLLRGCPRRLMLFGRRAEIFYEQLAAALLFRYFSADCLNERDALGACRFTVLAVLLCLSLEMRLSPRGACGNAVRLDIVRRFSAEVEYQPQALAHLRTMIWEEPAFDTGALLRALA